MVWLGFLAWGSKADEYGVVPMLPGVIQSLVDGDGKDWTEERVAWIDFAHGIIGVQDTSSGQLIIEDGDVVCVAHKVKRPLEVIFKADAFKGMDPANVFRDYGIIIEGQ